MKSTMIKILLVDDKESNLFALEELLRKEGRTFFKTTSGKEALRLAYSNEFDLILLDVQMPEMDGFEVAQLLKSNKRTREVPIIFATAEKKEQRFIVKGIEEGAVDYLFKPLDPEITRAKVEMLLQLELQKKELRDKNSILEKYEILINNCADLICTIDALSLRFQELNEAFYTMLGYKPEDLKGMRLPDLLSEESRLLIEEINDTSERLCFETQVFCRSGEMKWLNWNIVVKGKKWYANARDITEGKRVEEIKHYLSTVVKQSADAIYLHTTDGEIISWNKGAENIYGYSEPEALKMFIWDIIPDHLHEEVKEAIKGVLSGDIIPGIETKRLTKEGNTIDVLFSASIVRDLNHKVQSLAITERDITEQKIGEKKIKDLNVQLQRNIYQLQITNTDLESFSYTVSHDLRAPLRAINGYSRILSAEFSDSLEDESKRLLQKIEANALRMGVLIDDLLAFSKLGGKSIRKTRINMEKLIEKVVYDCTSQLNHKPSFKIKELPEANADYSLLNQVLENLISNAIKYSQKKRKPEIEIGAVEREQDLEFYVKDNGAGFSKTYEDKLFKVFQRLHSPDEFEGVGVGLAIVKRIIEKHEGKVWAEGKVGSGATFYFSIPR